jgi:uncharacterized protein
MKWRPQLFALHRDAGFLCLGLALVYAISGVAVNHKKHWNYNYSSTVLTGEIGPPEWLLGEPGEHVAALDGEARGELARAEQPKLVEKIRAVLGRGAEPRAVFWRAPDRLSLFFGEGDKDIVDYDPATGKVEATTKKPRFLLRWLNALHMNEYRRVWTWVGDGFALMLAFLAVSGAILAKGRRGLWGRGGALALAGLLIPVLLVLLLR